MHYKLGILKSKQVEQLINDSFIERHRIANPQDKITTGYLKADYIGEYGYILKDGYTQQFITDYIEIVDALPSEHPWHEEETNTQYQIFITDKQAKRIALHHNEMNDYMRLNNIKAYEAEEGVYFYVNTILPDHQKLFDYLQILVIPNNSIE